MTTQTTDPDSAAIHQAASDYYGGWYAADAERIARSLHTDLAKRAIKKDESGKEYLLHLSKEVMVEATREGRGSVTPIAQKRYEITILEIYEEIANVKVVSNEYIDYLHLAKQDGQWLIVNALYTDNRANNKA